MAVTGVVLLVIGLLVAISEAHQPTHGIAGGLGVAVMAIGVALALTGAGAGVAIGLAAAAALAAGGAGAVAIAVNRTAAVRRRRVRGGAEGLIGQIAVVRTWSADRGSVSLAGGVWQARRSQAPADPLDLLDADTNADTHTNPDPDTDTNAAADPDAAPEPGAGPQQRNNGTELHVGDRVVVENLSGLTLSVRPAEEWELI